MFSTNCEEKGCLQKATRTNSQQNYIMLELSPWHWLHRELSQSF